MFMITHMICELSGEYYEKLEKLTLGIEEIEKDADNFAKAEYAEKVLLVGMNELREVVDEMEALIGKDFIPFPNYEEILYSVKY